jgi:hypothetical protein
MFNAHAIQIRAPGPRPEFYLIAEHLWGIGCEIDSDGNSLTPEDREWTELTISLRSSHEDRVDIDQLSVDPLVLVVHSVKAELCKRTVDFIISVSGGTVTGTGT